MAASLINILFQSVCVVVAWTLRQERGLRLLAMLSLMAGLTGLFSVGWNALVLTTNRLPGISERVLTPINLLWLSIVGFRLTRLATGHSDPGSTTDPWPGTELGNDRAPLPGEGTQVGISRSC